ncbi:MAG: indolepyruvate ferredoxin oxidoreductase subunit alpha [Desulfotomaculaceae bacterium]|nr:indolepyruvate ferredoxin oxidoreductase subunit alpha [Desulfotomaculaceae bacterium]
MSWKDVIEGKQGDEVLLNGNEAIARGAIETGVCFAASYPGSPTTEIIETLARIPASEIYTEWSVNEIVSLEGAAAASFAGLRAMCVMKSDGLNVAFDFLTSMNLGGCKGGLVVTVADDPQGHSSVKEYDARYLAKAAMVPVLEPSSVEEAKDMTRLAFELSERIKGPVLLRSVTRIAHSRGLVKLGEPLREKRTAFFPAGECFLTKTVFHMKARDRVGKAALVLEECGLNFAEGPEQAETAIFCSGTSLLYAREAINMLGLRDEIKLVRVGTTYPLPEYFILSHLKGVKNVIFAEEVRPFLEEGVMLLYARKSTNKVRFFGKISGDVAGTRGPSCGEMNVDIILQALANVKDIQYHIPGYPRNKIAEIEAMIPPREYAMCPGCPHRASFWAVKTAIAVDGRDCIVAGDIGCYCLGAWDTGFNLFDTLHCMGAGPSIAGGLSKLGRFGLKRPALTFVGDSTFYHAVIPGLINGHYSGSDFMCIVLDNGVTAMTGHQPHPGTGITVQGMPVSKIRIEDIVRGFGVTCEIADPFDSNHVAEKICFLLREPGLKVLILRQECALVARRRERQKRKVYVDQSLCRGDTCGCGRFCTSVWGCPGNIWDQAAGKAAIDEAVCAGCGVCASLCPVGAIIVEGVD